MLPAKLTRPQVSRALARTRLYQHLDRARACPVVWVTGPPGAGKTTLVSSYLDARDLKGIWYQVDAGDDDPATFFHYMSIAARRAAPRYRTPLPAFTAEHRPGLGVFARRYFEALCSRLKAPAVLVLDNYQEVIADSVFHAIIAEAVAVLPKEVCLLVLSRAEPPPAFARLRANGVLAPLENNELKLTLDEARAMVRLRDPRKLDATALQRLHQRAHGWTAGLVLLLERPELEAPTLPAAAGHQVLFDYFATEIFHKLDPTTQAVLCLTALLPTAHVALAEQLTREPDTGRILADLYRRNYFIVKHGHGEVYQFHPLFHEFLLHRASEVYSTLQLNALRGQAATLLEAAGDTEAAAELWRTASDWVALVTHILKHAPVLAVQARFQILETWLHALPSEALDSTPWLRYWFGVCRMQFNLLEAQAHFERAYAAFARADEAAGLYLAWSGVVGCIHMAWRDFASLTPWLVALEDLRRRHPPWPSPEIELRVVVGAVIGYCGHRPDHPDLRPWLAHAQRLIGSSTDVVLRIQLASHVATALYWLGEYAQARWLIDSLDSASKAVKNMPITQVWWDAATMICYWHQLTPRLALQRCEQALASTKASGVQIVDQFLYAQAVYAALIGGDLPTAEKCMQTLHALLPPHSPLSQGHYRHLQALTDLYAGRYTAAVEHSRQALALTQAAAMPFGVSNCHFGLALTLLEIGAAGQAQEHIHAARAIGVSMGSRAIEFWCSAHEAYAAFKQGDAQVGQVLLARALALSREIGGVPMIWWPRPQIARLYARALEHAIEVEHVCDLIRRLDLAPPEGPVLDTWPFKLKIYTLGRFGVVIDGRPLMFAGKTQKKPLELLKGLIALGGREVREDKLARALWPAAEDAPQALATTVHRLRKLIGEHAIERGEGCLTLNPRYCWVDVWAFERQLAQLDQACRERQHAEIAPQIERLFARYGSGFLAAESDASWALLARERLRSKLLRQFETVADVLAQTQQHDAAIGCYRKALEIEPLAEGLYCGLMQCYAVTGRNAEALSTYERCRRILSEQLGVTPSPRAAALARQCK